MVIHSGYVYAWAYFMRRCIYVYLTFTSFTYFFEGLLFILSRNKMHQS